VEGLSDSLHTELSPVGVERQVAGVRAEAAAQVVAAHTERDESRREAQEAQALAARARQQAVDAKYSARRVPRPGRRRGRGDPGGTRRGPRRGPARNGGG